MTAERRAELRARWTKPPNQVVIELVDAMDSATERAERAEDVINTMLRCVGKNAGNVNDPVAAMKATYRSLVDARERTERAEAASRTANAKLQNYAIELGEVLGQKQRLLEDNTTLTRERDKVIKAAEIHQRERAIAIEVSGNALTYWREELEAERAGNAAMRKALETIAHCSESFRPLVRDVLSSSTAGVETLERLKELRDGAAWAAHQLAGAIGMPVAVLDNLSALANGGKPPHDWPYPADCERLRKAEAERDNLADCWQKAEGALNYMEISKNARIATLEAALEEARKALEPFADWAARLVKQNRLRDHCPLSTDPTRLATLIATPIHHRDPIIADLRQAHTAHERIGKALKP